MGNDFSNSEEEEFPEHFLLVKPCLINLLGGEKSGQLGAVFSLFALDMLSNTPEEEQNFSQLVNPENLC